MQLARKTPNARLTNGADPAPRRNMSWDAYWQDSRINSPGPEGNPRVEAALASHWTQAAEALEPGAAALDLACGNGTVSLAVACLAYETGKAVSLVGIDAAVIDPCRYVIHHAELLKTVNFRPMTHMESLPFADQTFDAVFSQFGVEYGEPARSVAELARVLKRGGTTIILTLLAEGGVIEQSAKNAKQVRYILDQTKLIDIAFAVVQALHNIENVGEDGDQRQYLNRFNTEVERTMDKYATTDSSMVAVVIDTLQKMLTNRKTVHITDQLIAIANLRQRLTDYVARTETMIRVAVGDAGLNGLKRRLTDAGLVGVESRPLMVGIDDIAAWRISGRKP